MSVKSHLFLREDCSDLSGHHSDTAFFECTFRNLNGLTLENCDLNGSKFATEDIREALGFTMTLNCFSFNNVEYSPLLFDLFLMLACKSKGNDEKRKKLLEVIGRERAFEILSLMKNLE